MPAAEAFAALFMKTPKSEKWYVFIIPGRTVIMKLRKLFSTIVSTACAAVMVLSMSSCGHNSSSAADSSKSSSQSQESSSSAALDESKSFVITLYSEYAPVTCENFEKLVKEGFYDGTVFHRVIDNFMAQGGGFDLNGKQKQASTIKGEFSSNGFSKNTISHKRSVVSMARTGDPDSASSQFFICYSDRDTFLDGKYAAYGMVTKGMEVVDEFLKVERKTGDDGEKSAPVTPITILKAEMIGDDSSGHHQAKFYVSF